MGFMMLAMFVMDIIYLALMKFLDMDQLTLCSTDGVLNQADLTLNYNIFILRSSDIEFGI